MEKITPQSTSWNQENLKFSNDILKCFENENIKTEYDALINNSQWELDDLFDDTEPLKESFLHRYKVRLEQLHIWINNFETTKNSNMKEQLIYEIIKKSSKLEQWSSCSAIQNEVSEIY